MTIAFEMAYAGTVAAGLGGSKRSRELYDQDWHQVTPHTGDLVGCVTYDFDL